MARAIAAYPMFFYRDTAYLGYYPRKTESQVIEVLFFGRMVDVVGARQRQVEAVSSLFALRDQVFGDALRDGRLHSRDVRMSVNRNVTTDDQPLKAGDEVAFFSIFSGG